MAAVLKGLSVERKALIVTADNNENVALSSRNIPNVTVVTANGVNVLDVLNHDKLIMTKAAVQKVEEVLA
jgi:large subunit ribosomal protein L4